MGRARCNKPRTDEFLKKIDKGRLPAHIAIIMDGNGRWAQERGEDRLLVIFMAWKVFVMSWKVLLNWA